MDFPEQSHIKDEAWDVIYAMRSPFRAKHINDSMFIEDLVTWRQHNVILENSDTILI
jgi:hypothetical protein